VSDLETALQWMREIKSSEGRSLEEVKHQEAIYERLRSHFIGKYQGVLMLNLATALFYGLTMEEGLWNSLTACAVGKLAQYPFEEQLVQYRKPMTNTQDCSGCGYHVQQSRSRANPCVSFLRPGAGPGPQRCAQHASGWPGSSHRPPYRRADGNGQQDCGERCWTTRLSERVRQGTAQGRWMKEESLWL
jgi:hypothetical protein